MELGGQLRVISSHAMNLIAYKLLSSSKSTKKQHHQQQKNSMFSLFLLSIQVKVIQINRFPPVTLLNILPSEALVI